LLQDILHYLIVSIAPGASGSLENALPGRAQAGPRCGPDRRDLVNLFSTPGGESGPTRRAGLTFSVLPSTGRTGSTATRAISAFDRLHHPALRPFGSFSMTRTAQAFALSDFIAGLEDSFVTQPSCG
jgi:hypothetical protein